MARLIDQLGIDMSKALGLDASAVTQLYFCWSPGHIGEIQATLFVSDEAAGKMVEVIKKYRFSEVPNG